MEGKQKALESKFEDLKKIIESKEEELQVKHRSLVSHKRILPFLHDQLFMRKQYRLTLNVASKDLNRTRSFGN